MAIKFVGGRLDEEPESYVKRQRSVNTRHSDGSIEHPFERGKINAGLFCQWMHSQGVRPNEILVLGCRVGYEMREFINRVPTVEVMGVDIIPEFIEKAKTISDAVCCDMHELPFDNDAYQCTFSAQALEHCYNIPKAIDEMVRVTRKYIYLSLPLESKEKFDENPSHYGWTSNPIGWIELFKPYPNWRMEYACIPYKNTFDVLFKYIGREFE